MKRFLFISLLCLPFFLIGQTKHEVALFAGLSNSGTDVHSWARHGEGLFAKASVAYGLNYTYNFNPSWGVRLGWTGTSISGDDKDLVDLPGHDVRAHSFTSPLNEVGLSLQWDLLGNKRYNEGAFKKTFSPYVLAGVAGSFTDPDITWNTESGSYNSQDLDDIKTTNIQIPVGVGIKMDLSQKMYLSAEVRHTIPMTDYLEGISLSANSDDNDSYTFVGLNLGFRLGVSDRDKDGIADNIDSCPDVAGVAELNGCPDADGDGITDAQDDCPMVAGVAALSGCPDGDGDGIADKYDDCPTVAGESKFKGCPDTDGDGIRDMDDKCPTEAGSPAYAGCPPPDADGDGVEDSKDMCPNTPGTLKGCPDTDGDGFADNEDKCPKVKGMLAGCPDTDGDGVADASDKCPKVKGTIKNNGCPALTTPSAPIPNWWKDLYFNTASSGLDKKARLDVEEIIRISKQYPAAKFMISGYTDSRGSDDMNQKLSERRAKAVYDILVKKGVDPAKLRYAGYGEQNPKVPNNSNTYKQNRRVEVRFLR